jgi:hypothetical protein
MTINGKIVLDADHGRVDKAADKTKQKYQEIGKSTKTIGDELGKWGKQAANTLVGIGAIVGAIRATGEELRRQRQEAAAASKSKGESLLERGRNARALGLDIATGSADRGLAVVQSTGGVDQSVIDSFIGGQARRKKGERPKAQAIIQAVALLQTGFFSESEVTEAVDSPSALKKLQSQVSDRESRLSKAEKIEMATQKVEREQTTRADNARAGVGGGFEPRVTQAIQDRQDAENPIAATFFGIASKLTNGASDLARDAGTVNLSVGEFREATKHLRKISQNTQQLPRPNFNTDAGGN